MPGAGSGGPGPEWKLRGGCGGTGRARHRGCLRAAACPGLPVLLRGCRFPTRGAVPPGCAGSPTTNGAKAPAAPQWKGCTRVGEHMHVAGHTCGTVVPRCVTQQGHGCLAACWHCPGMGTRAVSLAGVDARWAGHPTLSPMASAPGSRHTPGRMGWRVGRALAAGGWFCSPPLQGALSGASMEGLRGAPLPWLGRAAPGDCGRAVRAHVGAQCVPARTRAACRWQPDMGGSGGAASLPRGPAGPGVHGRSGATCAHACAHAGHLLKHNGGFSAALAGVEGCVWTVSAWSVLGAHGSAVCEKPFAFLGHVTTACAGWRLAARAASDVGRWPRGGRAGLWQRIWWGFVTGCCRWLGCLWSWWHWAGT